MQLVVSAEMRRRRDSNGTGPMSLRCREYCSQMPAAAVFGHLRGVLLYRRRWSGGGGSMKSRGVQWMRFVRATTNYATRCTSRGQCGPMHCCGYLEIWLFRYASLNLLWWCISISRYNSSEDGFLINTWTGYESVTWEQISSWALMAMAEANCALLAVHELRPFAATGSFICTNTETSNRRNAMRHNLTEFHKLLGSVIAAVWLAASRLIADF